MNEKTALQFIQTGRAIHTREQRIAVSKGGVRSRLAKCHYMGLCSISWTTELAAQGSARDSALFNALLDMNISDTKRAETDRKRTP